MKKNEMMILLPFFCIVTFALNIGIQDPRGQQIVNKYWKPTWEQIGLDIGEDVNVISLADDISYFSIARNYSIDIIFGAPTLFQCIAIQFNYAPYASIIQYENSITTSYSGAAIFSKRGSNITNITDLRDKRISLAQISFQAGCQAQWYEMTQHGLGLFSSAQQVQISGSYAKTISSVYNGQADVGFVRAGQIEILSTGGGPTIDNFQYVNLKTDELSRNFPWPVSTPLLPISLLGVSPLLALSKKIQILESLYRILSSSDAAKLANYTQWTPPQNYWPILQLQSKLGYIVDLNSTNVHCLTNDQVYDFVQCEPGFKVISNQKESCNIQGIACPEGNVCICKPCVKDKKKNNKNTILSIILPVIFILVFVLLAILFVNYLLIKKYRNLNSFDQNYQHIVKNMFGNSDHIELKHLLGVGSYGRVYLAAWNNTSVALKITQPFNKSINEGLLARGLIHENIVRTYDHRLRRKFSGSHDINTPVDILNNLSQPHGNSNNMYELIIIQEYCEHGNLTKFLQSPELRNDDGPNLFNILLTLLDVANGLKYLHDKSILHRDLNCNNILLQSKKYETHDTRSFKAKISDFGMISLFDPNNHNNTMNICGTISHMAPELITKGKVSFQSDIYAFGIIIWEIYCGQNAYHDIENDTIINHVIIEKKRPEWLNTCNDAIQNLAIACWQDNFALRPKLFEIIETLSDMIGHEITVKMKNSELRISNENIFRPRHRSIS